MRHRIARRSRLAYKEYDLGDGFVVTMEKHGSCVWYYASHLKPDGYVTKVGRHKQFSYRREAEAQIAAWKTEDALAHLANG